MNAGSASTAMSTTASHRTAAGLSAAELTADRQNSSASRMRTRDSTKYRTASAMNRPCLSVTSLQPASGRQESQKSRRRIRC